MSPYTMGLPIDDIYGSFREKVTFLLSQSVGHMAQFCIYWKTIGVDRGDVTFALQFVTFLQFQSIRKVTGARGGALGRTPPGCYE